MEVKHTIKKDQGEFLLYNNEEKIGEMSYLKTDKNVININHTFIEEEFRGKDLGLKLVKAAVEYMRAQNLKAVPSCPYVKNVFDSTPEYADVQA